ncbi:MAG: proton-conducting transporter membrane subunit, partial [Clostridia bacterium]
ISYDKRQVYIASLLLLFGFGAKAGMFPLHIWLPKAHAAAPAPASALLSGILTKAGIFGIAAVTVNVMRANTSWGKSILLLAVITMLLGGFLGILSTDIKRTLACSTMSQIGFI